MEELIAIMPETEKAIKKAIVAAEKKKRKKKARTFLKRK